MSTSELERRAREFFVESQLQCFYAILRALGQPQARQHLLEVVVTLRTSGYFSFLQAAEVFNALEASMEELVAFPQPHEVIQCE